MRACVCMWMLFYHTFVSFISPLGWLVDILVPRDSSFNPVLILEPNFSENVFFPSFPMNTYYRNQSIHGEKNTKEKTIAKFHGFIQFVQVAPNAGDDNDSLFFPVRDACVLAWFTIEPPAFNRRFPGLFDANLREVNSVWVLLVSWNNQDS